MSAPFPLPDVTWAPLAPFWAGAAAGELRLPHCTSCERIHWYPVGVHAEHDLEWRPVDGTGTLHSWAVVHRPFLPELAKLVPFATGLVALDVDPSVRLATRLVDCDPDALAIGQPVEVTFRPLTFPGVAGEVVAPLFRPSR